MITVSDKSVPSLGNNDSLEGESFVPHSFALEKLKIASSEYLELKRSYEEHIINLKASHEQHCQQNQHFYEEYIREVKKKAKFHVEGQRDLKAKMESDFQIQVAKSDEVTERLRDQLTNLRLTHQEDSRALRRQLTEAKDSDIKLRNLSTDAFARDECAGVISNMMLRVEMSSLIVEQEHERSEAFEQLSALTTSNTKLYSDAKAQQRLTQNAKDTQFHCREVLQVMLHQIENKEWQNEKEKCKGAEKMIALLSADSSEAELLREKEYSKLVEESLTVSENHTNSLHMLSQQHEIEVALLLQRYEEAIAVHKKQIEIQCDVSVVLEVEACVQRLIARVERSQDPVLKTITTADAAVTAELETKDMEEMKMLEKERETDNNLLVLKLRNEITQLNSNLDQILVRSCLDSVLSGVCDRERQDIIPLNIDSIAEKESKDDTLLKEKIEILERQVNQLNEAAVFVAAASALAAQKLEEKLLLKFDEKVSSAAIQEIKEGNSSESVIVPIDKKDQAKEEALRVILINIQGELAVANASMAPLGEEKDKNKSHIQQWVTDFTRDNGREPADEDKKTVRVKYQAYQKATKNVKAAADSVLSLEKRKKDIEEQLSKLTSERVAGEGLTTTGMNATDHSTLKDELSRSEAVAAPVQKIEISEAITAPVHEIKISEAIAALPVQTMERMPSLKRAPSLVNLNADGKNLATIMEENNAVIEGLEDKIYQLQQDLDAAFIATAKGSADNSLLTEQLEALIREKRTDVVKRYEEEIQTLRTHGATLQVSLTELKTSKAKNETKIAELNERAEAAEGELRTRDANEQKGLSPKDEKVVLKVQVGKQRDDIVMKAKAATAGWNAAAAADERLDLDVDQAYRRGRDESVKQHSEDMKALNASLEIKETRITDIMVSINGMEKKVREAEDRESRAVEAGRLAREDAQEAIATFGVGGGGGGGEKEIEAARDQLDAAQEELVLLSEKCDGLVSSLDLARQKGQLLEQLVATAQASTKAAQLQTSAALSRSSVSDSGDVTGILLTIKGSLTKGATLIKNNRKDDCFDLYSRTCDELFHLLYTPSLRSILQEGAQQGRAQSMGGGKKERGGVVLKKTLDRLVNDLQQPETRRVEEELKREAAQQESSAGDDAVIAGLNDQLAILVKQENIIAQREMKEKESGGIDGGVVGSTLASEPLAVEGGGEGLLQPAATNSSSLLQRAREAEGKVEMLKRQMAAMARDRETSNEGDGDGDGGGDGEVGQVGGGGVAGQEGRDHPSPLVSVQNKVTSIAKGGVLEGKGGSRGTGTGGDVNPAEVRKLKKKVQELEAQVQSGGGAGGGGGDKKAIVTAANSEKALSRKIKEMESAHRKEKSVLESRLSKAEATLEVSSASLPLVAAERDHLRSQVKKFKGQEAEIEALKGKGLECKTLADELVVKGQEFDLLTEQYKKENALRKKYKNELEDLKGAIRVYARCRPMVKYERDKGCKQVVEFVDDTSLKITAGRGEKEYEMDTVFDQKSTQEAVFEDTRRLVESFMDGFNVCLFAYGQTGSGKTFTMTGSQSEPGLTPRAVNEIYRLIQDRPHCDCTVTTYFVELYNDQLVDLLWLVDSKDMSNKDRPGQGGQGPPHLDIKVDEKKMVYVKGSVIKEAATPASLLELFTKGNAERHTGATNMNAESSRSHSIFSIMVESYDRNTKRTVRGKLSLVDLAGSERAEKTGGNAERLKEGQSINKSLSALGDVMAALSEGGKAFIPYRNNKLTQLMQDSLGGNAKTLMFVNFSPADYNADETVTSLNFAARVKKVVNNASKQAEGEEVIKLRATIKRLLDKTGGGVDADEAEEAVE